MSVFSCPICGKRGGYFEFIAVPGRSVKEQHRCNPRVLRAIDAAAKREPKSEERTRSEYERFLDGMKLMGQS